MIEYISRQMVLSVFGEIHPLDHNANAYVEQIKRIPSVEVRPLVRGKWIDEHPDKPYDPLMRCSACGKVDIPLAMWNFCPNCGAEMHGKDGI